MDKEKKVQEEKEKKQEVRRRDWNGNFKRRKDRK